jgi:hypothetical protein
MNKNTLVSCVLANILLSKFSLLVKDFILAYLRMCALHYLVTNKFDFEKVDFLIPYFAVEFIETKYQYYSTLYIWQHSSAHECFTVWWRSLLRTSGNQWILDK